MLQNWSFSLFQLFEQFGVYNKILDDLPQNMKIYFIY